MIRIIKKKVSLKNLGQTSVDWVATVKEGRYIYHLNEHSKGYKYIYYWDKKDKIVKNLYFYRFIPTRANKRILAKLIKVNKQDYFEK